MRKSASTRVDFIVGDIPAIPIQPLLGAGGLIGLRARRAIVAGEPLTATILRVPPVVRSGDDVQVTVRIGVVEVRGTGTASRQRAGGRHDPSHAAAQLPVAESANCRTGSRGDRGMRSILVVAAALCALAGPRIRARTSRD